jgi:hypothetical protein
VKVNNGRVDGTIERVDERWEVRAIRHFRDDVRKVEFYNMPLEHKHGLKSRMGRKESTYCRGPSAGPFPCSRGPWP